MEPVFLIYNSQTYYAKTGQVREIFQYPFSFVTFRHDLYDKVSPLFFPSSVQTYFDFVAECSNEVNDYITTKMERRTPKLMCYPDALLKLDRHWDRNCVASTFFLHPKEFDMLHDNSKFETVALDEALLACMAEPGSEIYLHDSRTYIIFHKMTPAKMCLHFASDHTFRGVGHFSTCPSWTTQHALPAQVIQNP